MSNRTQKQNNKSPVIPDWIPERCLFSYSNKMLQQLPPFWQMKVRTHTDYALIEFPVEILHPHPARHINGSVFWHQNFLPFLSTFFFCVLLFLFNSSCKLSSYAYVQFVFSGRFIKFRLCG